MQSLKIKLKLKKKKRIYSGILIILIISYSLLGIQILLEKTSTQKITKNKFKEDYDIERLNLNDNLPTLINGSSSFFRRKMIIYAMESVNFTFFYTDALLNNSIVNLDNKTYTWQKYDSQGYVIDESNGTLITAADNSHILDINTKVLSTGEYIILIYFYKIGYEPKNAIIDLSIKNRPTLINNTLNLGIINKSIFVGDSANFTFSYKDYLTNSTIYDIDNSTFCWFEFDSDGFIKANGQGNLILNSEDLYVIDFSTDLRNSGNYSIKTTLSKENYTSQTIEVLLTINIREFEYQISDNFKNNEISVLKGDIVRIELNLTDISSVHISLTNATINLSIDGYMHVFSEISPGFYIYVFNTENYNTFFEAKTIKGVITITKDGYTTEEIDIKIIIEMEQIVPGFPTFHLLNVLGAVLLGLMTILIYRYIQKRKNSTIRKTQD